MIRDDATNFYNVHLRDSFFNQLSLRSLISVELCRLNLLCPIPCLNFLFMFTSRVCFQIQLSDVGIVVKVWVGLGSTLGELNGLQLPVDWEQPV